MSTSRARISLLARLFAENATYREIEVGDYSISLKSTGADKDLDDLQATDCQIEEGLIWASLRIRRRDGQEKTIGGLRKSDARAMKTRVDEHIGKTIALTRRLISEVGATQHLVSWIQKAESGEQWVANRHINWLRGEFKAIDELLGHPSAIYAGAGVPSEYMVLNNIAASLPEFRNRCNEKFRYQELNRFEKFFKTLPTQPTTEQREAVVCDEDATLVVAAAGSGKTTLLLTKIGYLLEKGLASPGEILILAFNRSAKETLQNRLYDRTGEEFEAHTFHSFGLHVLADAFGQKPSLAPYAESDFMLTRHIERLLKIVMEDPRCKQSVLRFFSEYLRPHKSAFDFKTHGEYLEYVRSNKPISLQGEELRSMEELTVANTLFFHGVRYRYEDRYKKNTATRDFRQYQPDFYLPDFDIYIEHFALDEMGKAPIHFKNYEDGVRWKRELHKTNGTTLIETYSYQAQRGVLQDSLLNALKAHGVPLRSIDQADAVELLNSFGYVSDLAITLKTFLHLFKGRGESIESLQGRIDATVFDGMRTLAFLEIFRPVFDLYEMELKRNRWIDFDDMINQATGAIVSGAYKRKFSYVVVDEFQDISLGRAMLLRAIKSSLYVQQLFVVGDDWQAINRFAGGDVTVMTSFEDHFGYCSAFTLTQTFRFNNMVNDVASRFVLKNPEQLPKAVKPYRFESENQVIIVRPVEKGAPILRSLLSEISIEAGSTPFSVLVLGRYRYVIDELSKIDLQDAYPNLELSFSTVHSAKGQEADYVVVLNLAAGTPGRQGSGFPSEAVDDPLFAYVLASSDRYENAEERRLFYVALTRTKRKVYLIVDPRSQSKFVDELLLPEYSVEKRGFDGAEVRNCPLCESTPLVTRIGAHGSFLGCRNFPYCAFTTDFCKSCGTGFFKKVGLKFSCDNPMCKQEARACPVCEAGYLIKRDGRYGAFWGCSSFSTDGCRYTEKA